MRTTMTVNEGVAHITIDDGKVNAMSAEMLDEKRVQAARQRVAQILGAPKLTVPGKSKPAGEAPPADDDIEEVDELDEVEEIEAPAASAALSKTTPTRAHLIGPACSRPARRTAS